MIFLYFNDNVLYPKKEEEKKKEVEKYNYNIKIIHLSRSQ